MTPRWLTPASPDADLTPTGRVQRLRAVWRWLDDPRSRRDQRAWARRRERALLLLVEADIAAGALPADVLDATRNPAGS